MVQEEDKRKIKRVRVSGLWAARVVARRLVVSKVLSQKIPFFNQILHPKQAS